MSVRGAFSGALGFEANASKEETEWDFDEVQRVSQLWL